MEPGILIPNSMLVLVLSTGRYPRRDRRSWSKLISARDLIYKMSIEADFRHGVGERFNYFKNIY